MDKVFIGIDYSMTCPSVCIMHGMKIKYHAWIDGFKGPSCISRTDINTGAEHIINIHQIVEIYDNDIDRYAKIATPIIKTLEAYHQNDVVAYIEGYSMASHGRVFAIAENTAVLKYILSEYGIKAIPVAPSTIKKFGSGSGRAKKEDMFAAFKTQTSIDLQYDLCPGKKKIASPVSDLVDSYYIACYGKHKTVGKG